MSGKVLSIAIALFLGIAGAPGSINAATSEQIGARGPAAGSEAKGVVVLAVRWDRRWGCGSFENAQLRVIGFDKLPSRKPTDEDKPDLILDDAPRLFTQPRFDSYVFAVEPGEYGLSKVEVKVARSSTDVGTVTAARSFLLKDGIAAGGSFQVGPGEIVYIGHFYVTCNKAQPSMWRYYMNGRQAFDEYLTELKGEYPWIDTGKVSFRLFDTKVFGLDYKLPEK